MTQQQWDQIKAKLYSALELQPGQRSAYLDEVAGEDSELRRELESLIASHERAGADFLDTSTLSASARTSVALSPALTGKRLGPYQVVSEIGVGGMGHVYRAVRDDGHYRQEVAIKVVHSWQSGESETSRFRNERQILATLEHPNIARLLDGGNTQEGAPYLVMELIEGEPIDEYCNRRKLSIQDRLKLFLQVCAAVQYAHQRLIIHRDLKPGNILVTSDGVPKLLDFGIAKILHPELNDSTLAQTLTLTLARALTPGYASPEQVKGEPITTASDVYSLGVVLYELLTGRSPYGTARRTVHQLAQAVCEFEPEKPSVAVRQTTSTRANSEQNAAALPAGSEAARAKLSRSLRGDLDTVILRALAKEVERRYQSVEQFDVDIQRHLSNLPITARRDAIAYRVSKFITRHKAGVAAAVIVFVSLSTGLGVAVRQARIARQQRVRAEQRFNDVRKLANSLIFEIHDSIRPLAGATASRRLLLERAVQYLDSLAQESRGDVSLQRELAAAYQRIGLLQGNATDSNLGKTDEGIRSLEKSLGLLESVARANPNDVKDQLSLAHAHRVLASILNNSGRPGTREHLEQALAICEQLQSGPQQSAIDHEIAALYADLAGYQDDAGDATAAANSMRKSLAMSEALWRANPSDNNLRSAAAVGRVQLGNLLPKLGLRNEALDTNRGGLDLFEEMASDPADVRSRRQLAVVLFFRGDIFMMNADTAAALQLFRRALALFEGLEKTDEANVLYKLDLAGGTASVGRALTRSGATAQGLEMVDRAIAMYEEGYARDHSYTDIPHWLGQNYAWKGDVLFQRGDTHNALEAYRKAVSYLESLSKGTMRASTNTELATSYAKLGFALSRSGDHEGALKAYHKSLDLAEPLAAANPSFALAQYALSDAYFGMGDASAPGETACAWFRKSADAWKQIANPSWMTPSDFQSRIAFASRDASALERRLSACTSPK